MKFTTEPMSKRVKFVPNKTPPPKPEIVRPVEKPVENIFHIPAELWDAMKPVSRANFNEEHSKPNLCKACGLDCPAVPVGQERIGTYVPSPLTDRLAGKICRPSQHDACRPQPAAKKPDTIAWWDKECPADMKSSTFDKLPNQEASKIVLAWVYGTRGLLLHGVSRRGKTRTVWMLLGRISAEGHKCEAWDAAKWANECARRFEDKSVYDWLAAQCAVDVLFIDDLDKAVFTDRIQTELFDMFKTRCNEGKPTIFTTNVLGDGLQEKFDIEVGIPFVDRVREYCERVKF